jgi:hypothetical protein
VEEECAETWATIIGSVKAVFDMNVPSGLRVGQLFIADFQRYAITNWVMMS